MAAGLAVLALAALAGSTRSTGSTGSTRSTGSTGSTGARVTYLEKSAGLVDSLDAEARARFLSFAGEVLRAGLPMVTVTSARRSPEWQADAMLNKVARGEDITKLYRSSAAIIRQLLALPRTVAAWAPVLAATPVSDHQRGRAVDVRRWGYTDAQLQQLQQLAQRSGWRTLLESDHLHLEL